MGGGRELMEPGVGAGRGAHWDEGQCGPANGRPSVWAGTSPFNQSVP